MSTAVPHDARSEVSPTEPTTTMVVIAGMHRSGTSALARSCNLLGVDLGDGFLATQPDNPSGFWEDAAVKEADDRVLASHGLVWDDVRLLPSPWRDGLGGDEARQRLRATIAAIARRGPLCGVKDPRISRLLSLWLPLLDELRLAPAFVIALRDPLAVARSLARRDGLGQMRSLVLWLQHTLEAERHTRRRRRSFVCFDELLADWRAELSQVARQLGITWPRPIEEVATALGSFLDPGLRHHATPPERGEDSLTRLAYETFTAVRALRDGETAARHAELDRIHAMLETAVLTLGPLLDELEREPAGRSPQPSIEMAGNGHRRSLGMRELDRARRETLLAHELVGRRSRELVEATALVIERTELVIRRDRELAEAQARLAQQDQALSEVNARLTQRERELAAAAERIADGERKLAAATELVAERDRERCEAQQVIEERDRARTEVATSAETIASLRHQLEAIRQEAEDLRAKHAAALSVIEGVERSVSWRLTSPLRALAATVRGRRGG